jgi:single-stranded-DNA-specific exonuclease
VRHDLTARLEANEWRGAVEPRLVIRSLHTLDGEEEAELPTCATCECRSDDAGWWQAVWDAYERPEPVPPSCAAGAERTTVDRCGEGALGVLGDLMTTGEPLLVMCADVSRRAGLLERDLAPERFGRGRWARLSSRCGPGATARARDAGNAPVMCEYGALRADPSLPHRFRHLFLLDPPAARVTIDSLRLSGGDNPAFLHLGFGAAEVEFAARVLDHEHGLRPHLETVYRALAGLDANGAEVSRKVLEGGGRHPRDAAVAGRCLRVLHELSLASFERSTGTLKCKITNGGRAELERSPAFHASAAAAAEGHRFLETLTPATPKARAA